tara:strand:+ start:4226 stop:4810 length:585 start_codon:yes stop_codon:yes gene_type:complete
MFIKALDRKLWRIAQVFTEQIPRELYTEKTDTGLYTLHVMITQSAPDVDFERYLKKWPEAKDLVTVNGGSTLMHYAARFCDVPKLKMILEMGVNIKQTNFMDETIMYEALNNSQKHDAATVLSLVEILLQYQHPFDKDALSIAVNKNMTSVVKSFKKHRPYKMHGVILHKIIIHQTMQKFELNDAFKDLVSEVL